jgi:hypothetical protein
MDSLTRSFFVGLTDELEKAGMSCATPGEKLRSKGKGKGLARGKGKGPMGMPKKAMSIKAKIEAARRDPSTKANPKDTGPKGSGTQDPRFKAMKKGATIEDAFFTGFDAGMGKEAALPKGLMSASFKKLKKDPKRHAQLFQKSRAEAQEAGTRAGGMIGKSVTKNVGMSAKRKGERALERFKKTKTPDTRSIGERLRVGEKKARPGLLTRAKRKLVERGKSFVKKHPSEIGAAAGGAAGLGVLAAGRALKKGLMAKKAATAVPGPRGSAERRNVAGMLRSMRGITRKPKAAIKLRESLKKLNK